MSIVLSPEVEQQIEALVRSGRFPSADAVVRAAVAHVQEALREQDEWRAALAARPDEIRALVAEGMLDLREGRTTTYDDAGLNDRIEQIIAEGMKRRGAVGEVA